jgi:hypothetical protein
MKTHRFWSILSIGVLVAPLAGLAAQTQGAATGQAGTPPPNVSISTGVPLTQATLPEGTGAISGTVVDSATGAPLVGAVVSLSVTSRAAIGRGTREVTDGRGRFLFTRLSAHDDYQVNAARPGYFDGAYGQTSLRPSPARIALSEGQWFATATIALSKGGAISGLVRDERGDPVVGVYVHVLAQVNVGGTKQLASGPVTLTDDRGMYRIAALGPGDYLVSVPSVSATVPASAPSVLGTVTPYATFDVDALSRAAIGKYPVPPPPENGRRFAYPAVYAPDATSPVRATPVTLALGETRTGVDVTLSPMAAFVISGRVDGLSEPLPGLTLRLLPAGLESLGNGSETATAMVGADGAFAFLNVPAGAYTIDLRRSMMEFTYSLTTNPRLPLAPGATSTSSSSAGVDSAGAGVQSTTTTVGRAHDLWGRATVAVSGADVTGLVIPLRHGAKITGHITRDAKDKPPTGTVFLTARAEPANGSPATGMVLTGQPIDAAMNFELDGVPPGQYVLRLSRPGGSLVEAITVDGQDITNRPLDLTEGQDVSNVQVTLTDQVPTLSGTVRTLDPTTKGTAVVAFPVEPEQWTNYGLTPVRIRSSSTTGQGAFHLTSLPAGEYYVLAVPASDADGWQDPAFLKQAARVATRVTLKWGQTTTADLALVHVR